MITNPVFGANIKLLRSRRGRSQEETAVGLDVKRSSYSGYENGTAEPSFDLLLRLSEYFKISVDKLLKDDLTALSESQLGILERGGDLDLSGKRLRVLATTVNSEDRENVELVPEKAKAGYALGYADPEYISILPTFQMPFLARDRKYRTFQISGDSMPPVADGSWVTGEYVQNWQTIRDGQPYIVVTKDDGIVFKVLYNKLKENGNLLLCSTNPLYVPYEVPINNVLEIWKFVHFISAELPEPNLSRDELTRSVQDLRKEVSQLRLAMEQQGRLAL
ncbi:MAG: LexA family transcriptional regulator [Flavobacteriales bacterium]|nr:LexA family transcriptional regulator [Flavobacteriales bacterium]MBK6946038.1 LexA family transcriptional regulator [Flavobacteriales bacterium]MBK7239022.1 LexA family transcriptional regulator [Flavobacteriales bacterium]MBK7296799.1 LexA family transcriptional regulator [Flavobacteriales bacterium]MBK9536872.1 LexA family transcriptional regulator [Flavobacteriales bacterium]